MTKDCIWRDHEGERNIPVENFSPNKKAPGALHPYCRFCCRRITSAQRARLRQIKAARELARFRRGDCPIEFRPPEVRVLYAIKSGARTQPEIARQAKLPFDELGLVLVKLMIEEKKVASRVNEDTREYFLREVAA